MDFGFFLTGISRSFCGFWLEAQSLNAAGRHSGRPLTGGNGVVFFSKSNA
jgi:hypothetical protein